MKTFNLLATLPGADGKSTDVFLENIQSGNVIFSEKEARKIFVGFRDCCIPDNPIIKEDEFGFEVASGLKLRMIEVGVN